MTIPRFHAKKSSVGEIANQRGQCKGLSISVFWFYFVLIQDPQPDPNMFNYPVAPSPTFL